MNHDINLNDLKEYLASCSKESKIYLGADSERVNVDGVWHVDYMTCVIVHVDAKHGGKIFASVKRELDFDKKLSRPKIRLINEVIKVAELYLECAEMFDGFDVSIHLDLNPLPIHGSNCAHGEAIGIIKGMTGIDPVVKPHSWAASNVADAVKRLIVVKN
jgi:predicted RNase H-related nuclease YkuK (DUF458 family)